MAAWRDRLRDDPFAIAATLALVTLVLGGALGGVGLLALDWSQGCHPVAYGPQVRYSVAETSTDAGYRVEVTMDEGDRLAGNRVYLTAGSVNRSWASLDGEANVSARIEPGDSVAIDGLPAGVTLRVVWVPADTERPDSACDGEASVRTSLRTHDVGATTDR